MYCVVQGGKQIILLSV